MRIREREGIVVVEVSQDEFRDPELLEKAFQGIIERLKRSEIVIDLRNVLYVNSLGVAVLIAAQGIAMVHRTRIAFAGVQPDVRRVLGLTGIDQILATYDSAEDALRALRTPR